jgi:hypothetical protein
MDSQIASRLRLLPILRPDDTHHLATKRPEVEELVAEIAHLRRRESRIFFLSAEGSSVMSSSRAPP